jgi:hypothetical protein
MPRSIDSIDFRSRCTEFKPPTCASRPAATRDHPSRGQTMDVGFEASAYITLQPFARVGPTNPEQSCARRSYTTEARNDILGCFGRSDRSALTDASRIVRLMFTRTSGWPSCILRRRPAGTTTSLPQSYLRRWRWPRRMSRRRSCSWCGADADPACRNRGPAAGKDRVSGLTLRRRRRLRSTSSR